MVGLGACLAKQRHFAQRFLHNPFEVLGCIAIHYKNIEHALVVCNKNVVLLLASVNIFVPVNYPYRDKEQPTGQLAPYNGRVIVAVLYFQILAEH